MAPSNATTLAVKLKHQSTPGVQRVPRFSIKSKRICDQVNRKNPLNWLKPALVPPGLAQNGNPLFRLIFAHHMPPKIFNESKREPAFKLTHILNVRTSLVRTPGRCKTHGQHQMPSGET